MNRERMLAVLLLPIVLGACQAEPRPIITRRFREAQYGMADRSYVTVSAFATAVPSTPPQPPPRVVEADRPKPTQPPASAGGGQGSPEPEVKRTSPHVRPEEIDRTRVQRRIVLAVLKTDSVDSPANRIDQLKVEMALDATLVQFESWSRFETEYGAIELGGLSTGQSRQFSGTINAGPYAGEALPATAGATFSATNEMKEDVKLSQRYVKVAGALQPDRALLYEEGATGTDLVGTTTIDVTLRLEVDPDPVFVFQFGELASDKGPTEMSKVTFEVLPLWIPTRRATAADLYARFGGSYRVRLVERGDDTIMEGDDQVRFARGDLGAGLPTAYCGTAGEAGRTVPAARADRTLLASQHELSRMRRQYTIHTTANRTVHVVGAKAEPLIFSDRLEAEAFLTWLRAATPEAAPVIKLGGRYVLEDGEDHAIRQEDLAALEIVLNA